MTAVFSIGTIPVQSRVILAPMDGISDQPFRWLCRRMGSAYTVSEFINVLDVPKELNDFSRRTCFSKFERPFGYQLYGSEAERITSAAIVLSKRKPDFIDLNLGCSVRRIAGRGAGAGLLKYPQTIKKIISSLVSALDIPLTVKMRLSWNSTVQNFLEIAKIIEGEGAVLLCVHARSRDQGYGISAQWESIREIKKTINIPVIGNGDVSTLEDIQILRNQTGCDGVMIGRAALGNPWIFSNINKNDLSPDDILDTVYLHWQLMHAFYGAEKANILFKKHLKAYLDCRQFDWINKERIIRSNNPVRHLLSV